MGSRVLYFAILFIFVVNPEAALEPSKNNSRRCQPKSCGDQIIPYPFGLENSDGCFLNSSYILTCNNRFNPPRLFFGNTQILNISVETATAIAYIPITYACYNEFGLEDNRDYYTFYFNFNDWPFTFSSTRNKFTAIGCDTQAYLYYGGNQLGANCSTTCDNSTLIKGLASITQEVKPCSGIGCCQAKIPQGLKYLEMNLTSFSNHSNLLVSNPCDYAFLTADPNAKLVQSTTYNSLASEVVLDWAVGDTTCEELDICGPNTNCTNSNNGSGHSCSCKQGYAGNPYTIQGCQDINECLPENRNIYHCNGKCKNTPGNYTCHCSFGYGGDGKLSCRLKTVSKVIILASGIAMMLTAFVLPHGWIYKRKIQEHNQQKNGGLFLKQLSMKISKKALVKATDNFDAQKLLGEGGNGWVYKGVVDNKEIAIKNAS